MHLHCSSLPETYFTGLRIMIEAGSTLNYYDRSGSVFGYVDTFSHPLNVYNARSSVSFTVVYYRCMNTAEYLWGLHGPCQSVILTYIILPAWPGPLPQTTIFTPKIHFWNPEGT